MNEPRLDAERLGALLDGRLAGGERDDALARIAASEDEYRVFLETAAVLDALEHGDEQPVEAAGERVPARGPDLVVLRGSGTPVWRRPAVLALAAGIALIALLPLLSSRGGSSLRHPGEAVALLARPTAGLPPGWDVRPWRITRSGADVPLTPEARAARIGALHVDLTLAVAAHDARAAARLGPQLANLVKGLDGGTLLAQDYQGIVQQAAAGERVDELLEKAGKEAARRSDQRFARVGAWAEAARFAAIRSDAAFFATPESRTLLNRAADDAALANARAAVERLQSQLEGGGARPWPEVRKSVDALLDAVAS